MKRAVILAVLLAVTACERKSAPVVDEAAIATTAAEHKAVADTDAAMRDAAVPVAHPTALPSG